ncbi:MAG TPA: co-chaperone DjlA [Steroidobacteraceae bacterium]|nr:co-chaperone DjlA [Steroidobacteraceae bacterium]
MTGKIVGAILGMLLLRGSPWGLLIGLILGHFYDMSVTPRRRPTTTAEALEIGVRIFRATYEVMGHVAKSDGRVSEAEIAAAREVMSYMKLNGAQIHAAIQHFTRGKSPDYDLEGTLRELADVCAHRPDLLRHFLEIQVSAALQGADMQGPARAAILKVADLLDISRLEVAHMEAVLRIQREAFRARGRNEGFGSGGAGGQAPPRQGMQLSAAYQILEVDPNASDADVAKAYRRQLSKHHPDKLKANGMPDSMLEHAKQRTQQIIEAYELIKAARNK